MKYDTLFHILQASLFQDEEFPVSDWETVFTEMKQQSVAGLPGQWLKKHPVPEAKAWTDYCLLLQTQWIRVMYGQDQLLKLLDKNDIPCVIIKGAAAAMAYPHPTLRSMGDVDFLVKRSDYQRTASLLEANGYLLAHEKNDAKHHYGYSKNGVSYELHKRLAIVQESDDSLISLFEKGIDQRELRSIENFTFPVLPYDLNGLVLIFHINQHLRTGLGLRQIIDWMMYVNQLSEEQWNELGCLLKETGMERLAYTVTLMCQRYLGLRTIVENDDTLPCDELLDYIMDKGNFGRKAAEEGKIASFILTENSPVKFFKRLQSGGLSNWKAAREHIVLRPFAWIYQSVRILGILIRKRIKPSEMLSQKDKGIEQRKLIEKLGLSIERDIQEED